MDTKIWGPCMWKTLHLITFTYPEKPSYAEKKYYYDFFNNLRYVIPCINCRKNYINHLNEIPLDPHLDSKDLLIKWLIDIHNLVNKDLNKPQKKYKDVISHYSKLIYGKKNLEITNDAKFSKIKYIIIITIFNILILFLLWYYNILSINTINEN